MLRELDRTIEGAPNFQYREFVKSYDAIRHKLDNTPPEEFLWLNIEYLARRVCQPLRDRFGPLHIDSGYRCEELNAIVNGSPRSFHRLAAAVDIESTAGAGLFEILEHVALHLPFSELIAEYFPGGWVHVGLLEGREEEKVIKLMDANNYYRVVGLEEIRKLYDKAA